MTKKAKDGATIAENSPVEFKEDAVLVGIDDERIPLLSKKRGSSALTHQEFNGAVFNLSTTIIGAGIMALPAAMKVLGLGLGIAIIVFVAVLTEFSVEMLLRFSKASGAVSYGSAMGDAFGIWGRRILQLCVVINNIGILIVYTIIIGDVLSGTYSSGVHHAGVLEGCFGEHWWNRRFFVLVVITFGVFTPLACFKRIDSLRHTSAVAVLLALVFLLITIGIVAVKFSQGSIAIPRFLPDVTDINSVWRLFTVVPVLVTAYVCHFNVHSIENELQNPLKIKSVVQASLALCSTIYIMTSCFGFLLFGDSTLDDVLSNFDTDLGIPYSAQLNNAVRVSYTLHLMLVFPIIFHPLRMNLDGILFPSSAPLARDNIRFGMVTAGLISVVFVGANFIPSIWDAFQFTGSTAAVCLSFIFPAIITLRDSHSIASKKDKILGFFMVGLAVFASLIAIYSDSYAIFKKHAFPSE